MRHLFALSVVALLASCASSPGASQADGPLNVLFITTDDLNNDLGCYGHGLVQSPHIDRLAKRGVRFDRAYCQYPVCNPSRSSFMTGFYPEQTGVLSNGGNFRQAMPDAVTMSQHFMNHGYFAARVGKIYHYGVPNQIGTPGKDDPPSWNETRNPRGIDREVHDRIHTLQPNSFGGTLSWLEIDSKDEEHTDGIGATQAIELLKTHHPDKTGKPFFLAMGFYRPHTPYVAPSRYFKLYPREKIVPVMEKPGDRDDIPAPALHDRPKQRELTVAKRKEIIQAYYATITLMDAQVGRLLDALDRLDLTRRTAIVFVSDHGYHLGHKGLWQKSDLFDASARVPLIIALPGMKQAGKATNALTELVDLYPTLADVCGLSAPKGLPGVSLKPVLEDPSLSGKAAAFTVTRARGKRPPGQKTMLGHTIRTARYRYTEWGDGEFGTELYDYQTDPEEITNLVKKPEHAATLARMQALMKKTRTRTGKSSATEEPR